MRILHTADWHVGKKLGRFDRLAEAEGALDEVVRMAGENSVDLVIVAGDLFDRALPPFNSMGLVFHTLRRLADTGARVVAVAGNHDSAELFRVLRPYMEPLGITLAHKPLRPEDGGVVTVPSRDGTETVQVALFPFLHESQTADFMDDAEEWHKSYGDRVRRVSSHYAEWMARNGGSDTIDVLVGHFMVDGAVPSGSERALHIGEAFMATPQAIPSELKYAALGHIHACQAAPGVSIPAHYSGSLLQLDFGEAGQDKFCLLVEASAAKPARVEKLPVSSGRKLLRVSGTLDELRSRSDEFGDAILDVQIVTDGPVPGLADEVREFLPHALYVRAEYERIEVEATEREGRRLDDLYAEYHQVRAGTPPSAELLDAFRSVAAEAGVDW